VMTREPSYSGINAHTCTSGVYANGIAARSSVADRSTTVEASARSRGPAGSPEGKTRSSTATVMLQRYASEGPGLEF